MMGYCGTVTRVHMATVACTIMEEEGKFDVTLKLGPSLNKLPAALLAEAMWPGSIENVGEETWHCGPAWRGGVVESGLMRLVGVHEGSFGVQS